MRSWQIREAAPQDAGAVGELIWMLWDHHHKLAPDRVLTADEITAAGPEPDSAHDKRRIELVAECEGRILGYAKLIVRDMPRSRAYPARSILTLQTISVRAEARRQGIGRALIERARQVGREHSVGTLQVPVLGFNTQALAFYRSLGFEDEFVLIGMRP